MLLFSKKQLSREVNFFVRDFETIKCPIGREYTYSYLGHLLFRAQFIIQHRCTKHDLETVCLLLNRIQKLERSLGYYVVYFNYLTGEFES